MEEGPGEKVKSRSMSWLLSSEPVMGKQRPVVRNVMSLGSFKLRLRSVWGIRGDAQDEVDSQRGAQREV